VSNTFTKLTPLDRVGFETVKSESTIDLSRKVMPVRVDTARTV
jgi:hypothetical protein